MILLLPLLLLLSGCTTREEDVLQILLGGSWGVYLVSLVISLPFTPGFWTAVRKRYSGLIFWVVASIAGILSIRGGSIIWWVGEPQEGVTGYFNLLGAIASGPLVGAVLSPLIFVYSAILSFLVRRLDRARLTIIPHVIAGLFAGTVLAGHHLKCTAAAWIWSWPLLLYNKIGPLSY